MRFADTQPNTQPSTAPGISLVLDLSVSPVDYFTRRAAWDLVNVASATVAVEPDPPTPVNMYDMSTWYVTFNLVGRTERNVTITAIGTDGTTISKTVTCILAPPSPAIKTPWIVIFTDFTWGYTDGNPGSGLLVPQPFPSTWEGSSQTRPVSPVQRIPIPKEGK